MGSHMEIKKRIVLSIAVFLVLLFLFAAYAITPSCPAVSCPEAGNCIGTCRSSVNVPVFLALVAIAAVLPPVAFKIYKRL